MNLEGKYIEINENNVKQIITFLYSKGYTWDRGERLKSTLTTYNICFNDHKYIKFISDKEFLFSDYPSNYYNCININKYFREEKLKRILK